MPRPVNTRRLSLVLSLILVLALFPACGAEKKAKAILVGSPDLKKSVLLVPPIAGKQSPCADSFAAAWSAALSADPQDLTVETDPALSAVFSFDPNSVAGPAPGPALLSQARSQGVNAICLGRFSGPFIEKKKTGLYGFRKLRDVGQIQFSLWIYDTLTAAKILDISLSRETVLDNSWPGQSQDVLACPENALADLAEEAADEALAALEDLPWSCEILTVDHETFTLSAGTDAGLSLYQTLFVRSRGSEMPGKKGRVYRVPGKTEATIRVTSVSEKTATAQLASGNAVNPGDWVFLKK